MLNPDKKFFIMFNNTGNISAVKLKLKIFLAGWWITPGLVILEAYRCNARRKPSTMVHTKIKFSY